MDFPVHYFYRSVLSRIGGCAVLSFVLPAMVVYLMQPSFSRLLLVCLVSLPWSLLNIYWVGLEKEERAFFRSKAKSYVQKKLDCNL